MSKPTLYHFSFHTLCQYKQDFSFNEGRPHTSYSGLTRNMLASCLREARKQACEKKSSFIIRYYHEDQGSIWILLAHKGRLSCRLRPADTPIILHQGVDLSEIQQQRLLNFYQDYLVVVHLLSQESKYKFPKWIDNIQRAIHDNNMEKLVELVEVENHPLVHKPDDQEIQNLLILNRDLSGTQDEENQKKHEKEQICIREHLENLSWSALDDAIRCGDLTIFEYLFKKSPPANSEDATNLLKDLMHITYGPTNVIARYLVSAGADPNVAFGAACRSGDYSLIQYFLVQRGLVLDNKEDEIRDAVLFGGPDVKEMLTAYVPNQSWLDGSY